MGDARARIAEDYLRVLRLFRFHAWYGKGEIDAEGLRAVAEAKDRLGTLSAERIAKELLRLLEAGTPAPVLRVMAATGILSLLLPERCAAAAGKTDAAGCGNFFQGAMRRCVYGHCCPTTAGRPGGGGCSEAFQRPSDQAGTGIGRRENRRATVGP